MAVKIEKAWGYEQVIYNGAYCMKLLVYTRRIASSLHFHKGKHETFYVASGRFQIEIGLFGDLPIPRPMGPGDGVVLEPLTCHRVRCLEPGTIIEASTHDDPDDCVRLIPSETNTTQTRENDDG
jgi:mannose-6-phosphate isomerase-like protein (cupin superfamily)